MVSRRAGRPSSGGFPSWWPASSWWCWSSPSWAGPIPSRARSTNGRAASWGRATDGSWVGSTAGPSSSRLRRWIWGRLPTSPTSWGSGRRKRPSCSWRRRSSESTRQPISPAFVPPPSSRRSGWPPRSSRPWSSPARFSSRRSAPATSCRCRRSSLGRLRQAPRGERSCWPRCLRWPGYSTGSSRRRTWRRRSSTPAGAFPGP